MRCNKRNTTLSSRIEKGMLRPYLESSLIRMPCTHKQTKWSNQVILHTSKFLCNGDFHHTAIRSGTLTVPSHVVIESHFSHPGIPGKPLIRLIKSPSKSGVQRYAGTVELLCCCRTIFEPQNLPVSVVEYAMFNSEVWSRSEGCGWRMRLLSRDLLHYLTRDLTFSSTPQFWFDHHQGKKASFMALINSPKFHLGSINTTCHLWDEIYLHSTLHLHHQQGCRMRGSNISVILKPPPSALEFLTGECRLYKLHSPSVLHMRWMPSRQIIAPNEISLRLELSSCFHNQVITTISLHIPRQWPARTASILGHIRMVVSCVKKKSGWGCEKWREPRWKKWYLMIPRK